MRQGNQTPQRPFEGEKKSSKECGEFFSLQNNRRKGVENSYGFTAIVILRHELTFSRANAG
ncbi:MAG: hypothetical protein CM15mP106_6040 [Candidatus Neomarinimicrobiota bacterium]|nr:MAG: hypothetical protein CM15mP106_6040 [Candidatus Neomarinimicrobiota bacterium]